MIRKCPCAVWIEHPTTAVACQRILAAVDPEPFEEDADPARTPLNRSILEWGVRLAEIEGAELHVVHAWQFLLEGRLQSRAAVAEEDVGKVGDSFRREHEWALAELLAPYIENVTRVHLLKGNVADEISRLSVDMKMDLVVMGTVCRSGIAGWLIGNTAETVLDQIQSSILTQKPRSDRVRLTRATIQAKFSLQNRLLT